ncbi:Os07g0647300 [Oryza sativa Japonica Group]|uniref:Os07g0647300 protein n=1 Tax=Oryza sativa subsp. japonica TaxID=39947 RepID=Q0D441_ORYSJ|nr:Os07g0647300 [Oryza sativa Japonica Group]|eukprot:NP_001060468.2 Os07g0647300 [Oryza sativa Japonica Group]
MALARLGHAVTGRLRRPLHLLHPPPPPLTDHHASVAHSFALIHANTRARGFASSPYNAGGVIGYRGRSPVYTVKVLELLFQINHTRSMSTAAQAEPPSLSKAPTPSQTSSKVPLGARKIGLDKNDLDKAFIQLTLEFVTKQLIIVWTLVIEHQGFLLFCKFHKRAQGDNIEF